MSEFTSLPSVFRTTPILEIDDKAIGDLSRRAVASPAGRARICLHSAHSDPVQQMLIALAPDATIAAHRQIDAGHKTYCVIDGELQVTFYDNHGAKVGTFVLGADRRRFSPLMTFPSAIWHACVAGSTGAIYLEIIAGPYRADVTEWRQQIL